MSKQILLVGCGNIGRRHLEGIMKYSEKKFIHIVEPNIKSKNLAKKYLKESIMNKSNYVAYWYDSIEELNQISDFVIIATNSVGRVDIINQLLEQGHRKFLIEKMVCQSNSEYLSLISKLKIFNAMAWVNTNRRYFKVYQKIKAIFANEPSIDFTVFSTSLGLGTNTIHYVDLFNWITNQKSSRLNGSMLSKKLLPNKRGKNYYEFSGIVLGKNKKGTISIISNDNNEKNIFLKISSKNYSIMLDEINGIFYNLQTKKNSHFEYEHVSKLTPIIISDILKNNTCTLPSVVDMYDTHQELFKIFNLHLKKVLKKNFNLCPIT